MKNVKKIKTPVKKGVAKVPVVMQLEALECGAASLTMILAYYEKWLPLEQVRSDCGVSRDGANAKNILKAARSYGLQAGGYRMEPETLREEGFFPCIIHWNFNHFVVCDGFKGNKVYLNDPAQGTRIISMEEFDKSFTGVTIFLEPSEIFEPSGKKRSILSYTLSKLKGSSVAIAFVVLTMIISSIMGIINPAFSRIFLDHLLTGKNKDWMQGFFIGLAGMGMIELIVNWIKAIYALRINGKMAIVGNTSFMWKVLRLPIEFYSQRMVGDIQGRRDSNAMISSTIVDTLAPLAINSCMMLFYLFVMIRYNILLTIIGITTVIVNTIVSDFISKKRINITRVQMRDAGKLLGTTISGIEMIETIKSSGAENGFFEKWSGYQASVNTQTVKFTKLNEYLGMIPEMISGISSIVILVIGVYLAMNGLFTIGMIMAFQGFLTSFFEPASEMITAGQTLQEMTTQIERLDDVMKYPTDVDDIEDTTEKDISFSKLTGNLVMENVTFGYSRLGEPLVKDFNLILEKGKSVAFVGASGCGKSTLSKLISGLYKPWSGDILFDGKKISEIDRNIFTGSLAVVDQDIIVFEDTIAENIRMWDKTIEDFEIILAARDAKLHEDIMKRDGGYQAKLLEGGKDFSGGQRQRLEIARVLAQDPTIVIMDEATSALDAKTEYEVVQGIRERGITCIVVAHRLSTIKDCDEIIVLNEGKVVERGTHEELFKKGGYYTELVSNE